jgi:hypothetical protein
MMDAFDAAATVAAVANPKLPMSEATSDLPDLRFLDLSPAGRLICRFSGMFLSFFFGEIKMAEMNGGLLQHLALIDVLPRY